jgi:hypothetical protein
MAMSAGASGRAAKGLACVLAALWLVACSTPSQRLVERVEPVSAVWVVCWLGPYAGVRERGPQVQAAMRERLPALLARNGLPVSGYLETVRPLRNLDELNTLWQQRRGQLASEPSHVLVITAQRSLESSQLSLTDSVGHTIEYEAVLWEPARSRLAWKATPQSASASGGKAAAAQASVNARVDELGANLLRALYRDALVALPGGSGPVDPDGRPLR